MSASIWAVSRSRKAKIADCYLDISKIDTHDYDMAQKYGQAEAESCEAKAQATGDARWFRRWPLKQLREELKIFPVE